MSSKNPVVSKIRHSNYPNWTVLSVLNVMLQNYKLSLALLLGLTGEACMVTDKAKIVKTNGLPIYFLTRGPLVL